MTLQHQHAMSFSMDHQNIPGITICNDRPHVVYVRSVFACFSRQLSSRIPMFPIVHLLCLEKPLHLIRDSVIGIVTEVRGDLIGGRQKR